MASFDADLSEAARKLGLGVIDRRQAAAPRSCANQPGRRCSTSSIGDGSAEPGVPASPARGALAGAEALVVRRILAGKAERLRELAPDIVYWAVTEPRTRNLNSCCDPQLRLELLETVIAM